MRRTSSWNTVKYPVVSGHLPDLRHPPALRRDFQYFLENSEPFWPFADEERVSCVQLLPVDHEQFSQIKSFPRRSTSVMAEQ
jgi:hypothetical protein